MTFMREIAWFSKVLTHFPLVYVFSIMLGWFFFNVHACVPPFLASFTNHESYIFLCSFLHFSIRLYPFLTLLKFIVFGCFWLMFAALIHFHGLFLMSCMFHPVSRVRPCFDVAVSIDGHLIDRGKCDCPLFRAEDIFWLKEAPGKTLVVGAAYIALDSRQKNIQRISYQRI